MVGNMNLKEKNNKIMKRPETLAAVHTHTHTGDCHLENKIKVKKVDNKNKGRTMLSYNNIGLPLCAFAKQMFITLVERQKNLQKFFIIYLEEQIKIKHKRSRAGP